MNRPMVVSETSNRAGVPCAGCMRTCAFLMIAMSEMSSRAGEKRKNVFR